ncbi:TcdA/TcdB catalytic glycosyltransferase domain-containing protein [Dryocola sp. BD613]|uniref:TcdA/TcdB catalytic glycosyltransferase domain-containing protein n=1 Tax=Dryocola sp. BD613 TaxID=3133272 RepID=UPI003F4FE382
MKETLLLMRSALKEAWRNQVKDGTTKLPCDRNAEALQKLAALKQPLPNVLHFVWVGDLRALDCEYINLWQRVNKGSRINLWHDEDCSLSHRFHHLLVQYAKTVAPHSTHQRLIDLQNEAFHYIYARLDKGHNFNKLAIQFLQRLDIEMADLPPASSLLTALSEQVTLQSIPPLFSGKFAALKKYYYYEVILRGNFACASDIARLLILYYHGGIYIDTDTLPAMDSYFPKTKAFLKRCGANNDQYATAAMAEAVLQKTRNNAGIKNDFYHYLNKISGISSPVRQALYSSITEEAEKINLASLQPLGNVFCYTNFLVQSATPSLVGVYFSNVLGACPYSKTISILLRSISKRYRFLEKNDAIFILTQEPRPHHYLARLLTYRHESLAGCGEVTLALTGPGLIVEVLLGLCYHVLKLNEDIPPDFLSVFMQNDRYGIAFFDHTLHTPAGLVSSWMK